MWPSSPKNSPSPQYQSMKVAFEGYLQIFLTSGLCHTDLTIATQDVGVFLMPVLYGHEVADAGPQVAEFRPGEKEQA